MMHPGSHKFGKFINHKERKKKCIAIIHYLYILYKIILSKILQNGNGEVVSEDLMGKMIWNAQIISESRKNINQVY